MGSASQAVNHSSMIVRTSAKQGTIDKRTRSSTSLLIHRRRRVHHQRDDVANLLLGQNAVVAEARHQAARGERFGIVDLAPDIPARLVGESAKLAEAIKRGPDCSVRQLIRRELETRVTIRADRSRGIVGELIATSF